MRFRIGVHLGDIIEKPDGTVYGDGVNIAARLEGLALAGRRHRVGCGARLGAAPDRRDLRGSGRPAGQEHRRPGPGVSRPRPRPRSARHGSTPSPHTSRVARASVRGRWWAAAALLLLSLAGALALAWRGAPVLRLLADGLACGATLPTAHVAPITMSLAVGAIGTSADRGLPASEGEALREASAGAALAASNGFTYDRSRSAMNPVRAARTPAIVPARAGVRYVIEGEAAHRTLGSAASAYV